MYIKWIVCQVQKDKKQQFSLAQDRWIKTGKSLSIADCYLKSEKVYILKRF